MRKLIVKCMAFLLIIGGLTASFLISKPKNEVKADTPSLYYFDIDTSQSNYMLIILYMKDLDVLRDSTCVMLLNGYYIGGGHSPYESTTLSFNIQFLRYSSLDHDDWDAYVYNFTYPSLDNIRGTDLFLYTTALAGEGENISYNLLLPYYPTFKYYYDDGHDAGYQDGTNDRNAYWEDYIEDTYLSSTGSGYQQIFEVGRQSGFSQGQDSLNTMEWFETTASGVSNILQLKLLPSITIGALIFIPLMFFILKGVLWIWRRN